MPDGNEQARCPLCSNVVSDAARSECRRSGLIIVMCSTCLTEYFRVKKFDKDLSSLVAARRTQSVKVGR